MFFGKSLELLGMVGFNIFLGMTLTVTFLGGDGNNAPTRLTEATVSNFVKDMTEVALGKNPAPDEKNLALDQYAITTWLMRHVNEDSQFLANVNITQPNGMNRQETLQMNRLDYISQVLKDNKAVKSREADLHVEYVRIDAGGKGASVVFTSMEKARLPIPSENGSYEIPVTGTSYCEQKLVIEDTIIKVSSSSCTSNVSLSENF